MIVRPSAAVAASKLSQLLGFTPKEALLSATALGGQIMRMPDELGQVKAGFLADMILIDGDPLKDITILQDRNRIVGIMKDGVFHKDPGDGTEARARDLDEIHRGTPVPA